jgi:hypothetical protein
MSENLKLTPDETQRAAVDPAMSANPWDTLATDHQQGVLAGERSTEDARIAKERADENARLERERAEADEARRRERAEADAQREREHREHIESRRRSPEVQTLNDEAAARMQTRYQGLLDQNGKSRQRRNAEARAYKKDTDHLINGDDLEPAQAELILDLRGERDATDARRRKAIFTRNAESMGADATRRDIDTRTTADLERFHEENGEFEGLDKYILREKALYTREEYDAFRQTDEFQHLAHMYRDRQRAERKQADAARRRREAQEAHRQRQERRTPRDPAPTETGDDAPEPAPVDPTDDTPEDPAPTDPVDPAPRPREDDDTQEIEPVVDPAPTAPAPPARRPGPDGRESRDARYPMRGFRTWTERDLDEAHARARGEEVPEREGLLENNYFDILQDLPRDPDAIELTHLMAAVNEGIRRGQDTPDNVRDAIDNIVARLVISHPGLSERLFDVYAEGGALQHENAKMTSLDAQLIDLLHRYKGMERNPDIRRQIKTLYDQINEAEGDVPVNWERNADGSITPQEGSRTQHKGDWLIARHQGARLGEEFNLLKRGLIAEGEEHGPTGAAGRFWRRLGGWAVAPVVAPTRGVISLVRRRRAAAAAAPAPTDPYDRLTLETFTGTDPEATAARRATAQAEIDRNRERSGFDPASIGQADPERADRPAIVRPARAPRIEGPIMPPRTPEATGPNRRQRAAARLGQLVRPGGLAPSGGPAEAPGAGNRLPAQPMTEAEVAAFEARLNAEADAEEARRRAS